jgi:lipopolysaccharide export LptBFGC system permease protein LptF
MRAVRILSHYFVVRFLGLFATALVAAFVILATVELVLNFEDLSSLESFGAAAKPDAASPAQPPTTLFLSVAHALWIRLTSYYLADVIPIASFLAVFVTFSWAGRRMELVAIAAGGIRLSRIILPVIVTSIILSLATAVLHETLILQNQQISANQQAVNHRQPDFGRKAFWHHMGRTITNIAFADAESRTLHDVEIFERGPTGTIIRVIRTKLVQITEKGAWLIEDATVWTFDPASPTAQPKLETLVSLELELDAISGDALLRANPATLPLADLRLYLAANPSANPATLRRLHASYQSRIASPMLVFVFAWLALPFALRIDERGRFGGPAAAAIATLGAFFLLQSAGSTLALRDLAPPGLTPWLPMTVVILGSSIALRRLKY